MIAQIIRAFLLASATAATFGVLSQQLQEPRPTRAVTLCVANDGQGEDASAGSSYPREISGATSDAVLHRIDIAVRQAGQTAALVGNLTTRCIYLLRLTFYVGPPGG